MFKIKIITFSFVLISITIAQDLKQAQVTEHLSTRTIEYINKIKKNGDSKTYHNDKQTNAYVERGMARVVLGKFNLAMDDLNLAIMRNPQNYHAYYERGKLFIILEKYEESLRDLNVAIAQKIGFPEVFVFRSTVNVKLGIFDSALVDINIYEKSKFKTNELESQINYNKGISYYGINKFEESLEYINKSIINGKNLHLQRANIHRINGNFDLALEDINKYFSIKIDEIDKDAYLYRGLIFFELKKYVESEIDLSKYLKSTFDLTEKAKRSKAYLTRGISRKMLNQFKLASEDLNKLIEREYDNFEAYYERAKLLILMNEFDKAFIDINTAIENKIGFPEIFVYRSTIYIQLNNFKLAQKDINKFDILNSELNHPLFSQVYLNNAIIHYELFEYNESLKYLNNVIGFDESFHGAYLLRGNIHRIQGRLYLAMDDLNTYIQIENRDANAYLYRGLTYSKLNEYSNTIKDLTQFLRLTSGYHKEKPEALLQRAIAQFYQQEYNAAINDLNEVIKRESNHWLAYRMLAFIHDEKGNYLQALTNYNIAINYGDRDTETFLKRAIIENKLSHYENAESDLSYFILNADQHHQEYSRAFYERGLARFFSKNVHEACMDWNISAERGYENAMTLVHKNCN